jgi:hypothetical protein
VVFVSVPSVSFIGSEFEFTFSSLSLYEHTHPDLCKDKNKYTMEYRWSKCMAPLILNLALDGGEQLISHPDHYTKGKGPLVPIE